MLDEKPSLNELAHHGTKGMKWGVRHDPGHVGEQAKTKTIVKADQKWEKSITKLNDGKIADQKALAFRNDAVTRINTNVAALNSSDKYRLKDTDSLTGQLKKDYDNDAKEVIMRAFEDATHAHYGKNASGTKSATYNRETDKIEIRSRSVTHADETNVPDADVVLKRNSNGLISSVTVVPVVDTVKHFSVVEDAAVLSHHGVKGMKWGVRRERTTSALERVGRGEGSKRDKFTAFNNLSGVALVRNGGLQGAAANKAANRRAQDARRARGEATAADILKRHGGDMLYDLGGKDKDRR